MLLRFFNLNVKNILFALNTCINCYIFNKNLFLLFFYFIFSFAVSAFLILFFISFLVLSLFTKVVVTFQLLLQFHMTTYYTYTLDHNDNILCKLWIPIMSFGYFGVHVTIYNLVRLLHFSSY